MVFDKFSWFFEILCFCCTLSTITWCLLEYSKDEDVTETSFKIYGEDDESVYPDITLCLHSFLDGDKLAQLGSSEMEYRKFLKGNEHIENLTKINYENVSLQLKDHVIMKKFVLLSEETRDFKDIVSFNTPYVKCFTFSFPLKMTIQQVFIGLRNSLFKHGKRPESGFVFALHHPHQQFRRWQFSRNHWKKRNHNSVKSYVMKVFVKEVEVLIVL